ncbi:MAG: PLP-dependent transferase [Candidatus Bipolaricaulia bacterium]
MTHAAIPEEERRLRGIEENLLRISVGIENYADLERDLGNALERA